MKKLDHYQQIHCDWIRKYVNFHKMTSREDLKDDETKIETFLTLLAINRNVAPATQNQAMNALVFLYRKVLKQDLDKEISAVRSRKKINMPVVMTREENTIVLRLMSGTAQLVATKKYKKRVFA